ncbi:MAG: helix-turn-helix domain-containing protein [Treponema sp.]|nr:helix-turn-helix domain-containing protein [Treponema sp.]
MNSYGTILKKAREDKNLDINTVSRETSITPEYIKGLEEEDAGVFPGEPYMIGFLRNYAEYLGINPETVLSLYRNKVIQESPVPEGLLLKQKPSFLRLLMRGLLCAVVAAGIIVIILIFIRKPSKTDGDVVVEKGVTAKKYELSDKPFEGRLYRGDQIIIPSAKGKIVLTVSDTVSAFGLDTPVGKLYTDLSEEAELDIDGDAQPDIIVYVSDISSTEDSRGAEVRLLLKQKSADALQEETVAVPDVPADNGSSVQKHKQQVILQDTRAYPFTVNATFRGPCEFRYKIDHKASEENYFTNGDVVTMTANNGSRLWMSNCNTVKFSIIADTKNFDLDIGKAGQVLVEDIKWVKDLDGTYKLVVVELD